MSSHQQWRDCSAWVDEGLALSTTSNEACKLYDALVTQYVGWYDEASVGGMEKTMKNLQTADPHFVMGRVLLNGLELMGTGNSTRMDSQFAKNIDDMVDMAASTNITGREKKHVNAVKLWADGYMTEACHVWESILVDHPTDMLAVKYAHDSYFYLGHQPQMRDSIARVLQQWKPNMPLYSYLLGMYSFGLVETNLYDQAELVAKKGLELNRCDAWSTHSMAHVLEMTGRSQEGISFLSKTLKDWTTCGLLACHNFWHWAIYHIEKGEYQAALDIFDSEVVERSKSGAMLDIVDSTSLLYRLELEGVSVGDRWQSIFDVCKPHTDDHILVFNDIHVLMSCLGAKQKETTEKMMDSIRDFVRNGTGTTQVVMAEVGETLFEAFAAYDSGDFGEAVEKLYPVRYQILSIGGSNAQRDLFNLFLIASALKSSDVKHHRLARQLLLERKALREKSPMTERLMQTALALHVD